MEFLLIDYSLPQNHRQVYDHLKFLKTPTQNHQHYCLGVELSGMLQGRSQCAKDTDMCKMLIQGRVPVSCVVSSRSSFTVHYPDCILCMTDYLNGHALLEHGMKT